MEVGVQRGLHAKQFLEIWKGEHLLLVDKWEPVAAAEYVDIANVDRQGMIDIQKMCKQNLEQFFEIKRATMKKDWSVDASKSKSGILCTQKKCTKILFSYFFFLKIAGPICISLT